MMTKKERLADLERILNNLHDQVFGTKGNIEQAEKFQELGLDIDSICIALDDIEELKK